MPRPPERRARPRPITETEWKVLEVAVFHGFEPQSQYWNTFRCTDRQVLAMAAAARLERDWYEAHLIEAQRRMARMLAAVENDSCDGESEYAAGVNAACQRHAAGLRQIMKGGR